MNNHRVERHRQNSKAGRLGSAGLGSWLFGIAMTMVLALGAGIETVRAQVIESPVDLLERESNKVLKLLRDDRENLQNNPDKIYQIVDDYILPHLDEVTMAKLALGKNWKMATNEQKRSFVDEFRNLLVRTYSKSLIEFRDQTIRYIPQTVPPTATKASVKAEVIQPGGPAIPLAYSVRVKDDTWKVYDIQVDGVSLVTSYRGTFTQEVRKSGIDGLLQYLRDKNRDLSNKDLDGKDQSGKDLNGRETAKADAAI